jgi:hypothetical protein
MARLSLNVDQETFDSAGRSFEPVPVGRYKVTIFSITPDEVKAEGPNKGKLRLRFQFRIADGEVAADGSRQQNRRLFADINAFEGISKEGKATPPYDLVAIAKAMGAGQDELDDIDTDDWLGEELYVDVTWEEKKTKESGYKESFTPKQFRERTRGYRSVDSVETSAAATAGVKSNTGAKASTSTAGKAAPAKKQLIKL